MPIYAYRCEACGFVKDVLQKVSDAPLSDCLSCGKSAFKKQLTAAGFQLKGTGWYATDFRNGATPAAPAAEAKTTAATDAAGAATPAATAAAAPAVPAASSKPDTSSAA
jgi:putative FmdB family regulatory protein